MFTRLTHAAIAFAVTAVAYQVYVLAVTPFVEPSLAIAAPPEDASDQAQTLRVLHKHRELLSAYFPADHWTLSQPPKTFENGKAMIVMDEYRPNDKGELRINKCAILFFPQAYVRGQPPPRDAVVLEAPHGAVLQMDDGIGPGLGGFGRIQTGSLVGKIEIRSDMREPGPEDDLLVTTRNLYMNEDLIRTDAEVDMRLGPHWGRGRELEIRLLAVEQAWSRVSGPQIGGIDSLAILKDVAAQISPGDVQLFDHSGQAQSSMADTPVDVSCQGSFRFDFTHQVASFLEQVKISQLHPNGQLDRWNSEEMNFYFVESKDDVQDASFVADNEEATRTNKKDAGVRIGSIEALGTPIAPVVLEAPSQQATAHCQRMRMELGPRRITFDRGEEVVLTFQGSEIHARQLQYQAPPQGSSQRIGVLLAAGHGWLRALPGDRQSQRPFEARWTKEMRLSRLDEKPVLTLLGRPRLEMIGLGQVWANDLTVHLRERALDGSEADLLPGDVVPERIFARGQVAIDSKELSGNVEQLELDVNYELSNLSLGQANGNKPDSRLPAFGESPGKHARAYQIAGKRLQALLTVRDKQPEITSIDIDGNVAFRESNSKSTASQPLEVRGNHVRVEQADKPTAQFSLRGQPATITAAGMSISAVEMRLNRGSSRAWIDSPGQLQIPVERDLNGNALASPQFLIVRWQGGMKLEEDTVKFHGDVVANTNDGSVKTEELIVTLSAPVHFDGAAQQQQVELVQIECRQNVIAEFKQRDPSGLISVQQMQLESFLANQKTGVISGTGPGWLESVHLVDGTSPLGALAGTSGATSQRSVQRLRFLGVQFKRGVRGNLLQKRLEVFGDTQAVYGPVDSWQQRLEMTVRGNPGPETVWITSDMLGVAESPVGRLNRESTMGPVELFAEGDVTIEGRAGERGFFTTDSHTAKYDQQKSLFVLEGDGRSPATIYHQKYQGAPRSESSARKLMYNHATGELRGEGFVGGQFRQINTPPQSR